MDEKLLLERDEQRNIKLADGSRFRLGSPSEANGLLVPAGESASLTHSFGRVSRLGFVTTAVGFQPAQDQAQPALGSVRLRFKDGTEQEIEWDLRDSNGAGRGEVTRVAGPAWSLVRTSDGERWEDRKLYWQTTLVDETRNLIEVRFDASRTVDASGDDAEFAVLAVSAVQASTTSEAPLTPVSIPATSWNADLLATSPLDGEGRGFRERVQAQPIAPKAMAGVARAPLQLGKAVQVGAHYSRALLASEILRIMH